MSNLLRQFDEFQTEDLEDVTMVRFVLRLDDAMSTYIVMKLVLLFFESAVSGQPFRV